MIGFKNAAAALALSLAVAASASPVLAKSRAAHPGYEARAQAIGADTRTDGMTAHRAQALRECNELGSKTLQYLWGHEQNDQVRACMAQRGEVE
jgi:hypothetical protein